MGNCLPQNVFQGLDYFVKLLLSPCMKSMILAKNNNNVPATPMHKLKIKVNIENVLPSET